jgi:hypothetical protein
MPAVQLAHEIIGATGWLVEDGFSILSNLDPPRPLEDLQRTARLSLQLRGRAPPGYQIHHIVEQEAARSDGLPEELIQSWENLVVAPRYRHEDITGWFMRRNDEYQGLSPREYLRGKSWDERYRVGLRALIVNGVLIP